MDADVFSLASTFVMHVGARHMNMELTAAQKQIVAHPLTKIAILFAMFYVSTRSVWWSAILILAYVVVVNMLLNEKHPMNIFSKKWLISQGLIPGEKEDPEEKKPIDIYHENLAKLGS